MNVEKLTQIACKFALTVTILSCIAEVQVSIFGWNTLYSEIPSLQEISRISLNYASTASFHIVSTL
jgi:hypothetical protein